MASAALFFATFAVTRGTDAPALILHNSVGQSNDYGQRMKHFVPDHHQKIAPECRPSDTRDSIQNRVVTAITNPNLIGVALFAIVSCLIVINLMLRFPNLGLIVQQYNAFP